MIDVYDNVLCKPKNETTQQIDHNKETPKNLGPQTMTDWMFVIIRGILGFFTAYGKFVHFHIY